MEISVVEQHKDQRVLLHGLGFRGFASFVDLDSRPLTPLEKMKTRMAAD